MERIKTNIKTKAPQRLKVKKHINFKPVIVVLGIISLIILLSVSAIFIIKKHKKAHKKVVLDTNTNEMITDPKSEIQTATLGDITFIIPDGYVVNTSSAEEIILSKSTDTTINISYKTNNQLYLNDIKDIYYDTFKEIHSSNATMSEIFINGKPFVLFQGKNNEINEYGVLFTNENYIFNENINAYYINVCTTTETQGYTDTLALINTIEGVLVKEQK